MKTVTSEGNLSGYFALPAQAQMDQLNYKIKQIKNALKMAERHNDELHLKLKNQKENHQLQTIQLENQYKKYKELYEMLLEKYELKNIELKDAKKRLKRAQLEQQHQEEQEEMNRQVRETIFKQEKELIKVKEENRLLYEQLHQRNSKIKDLQAFLSKNYLQPRAPTDKDRSFLASLKTAIEGKNEDFEKVNQQRAKLTAAKHQLEKEGGQLALKLAKAQTEIEYQKKLGREARERADKLQRQMVRLAQQGRSAATRYQQLLNFTFEAQKDTEQQLQTITKEVLRREHR